MEKYINKSYSSIHVLKWENCFQKDSADFSHRNLTLKIGFLQSLKGQKELEEVLIKKIFEYKLSVGKCLLILNWAELLITTVDTLVCRVSILWVHGLKFSNYGIQYWEILAYRNQVIEKRNIEYIFSIYSLFIDMIISKVVHNTVC